MHVITHNAATYLLRFDKDEELTAAITAFCKTKNIHAGSFFALGAAGELVLSYYNLTTKAYEDKEIHEDVEIISILGNIALLDKKHMIHMHGSFSKRDFSVLAGHIKKLVVSATCEVTLHVFTGKIERAYDESTGLNLLCGKTSR